ncbi:MAG: hypothetical protein CMP48_15080 [Rickettsiales bacterium]|nr:hypothetical protein [Rickettsiales bacterium]
MFSSNKLRIVLFTVLSCILISINSCGTFTSTDSEDRPIGNEEVERYWLKFYKVNSRVKVYLNDDELYDSGINKQVTDPFKVGVSDRLESGKNLIRVDLFNGPPYDDSLGYDKYWEIDYEIFNYKEPIDFVFEQNDRARNGLVWSKVHEIVIE